MAGDANLTEGESDKLDVECFAQCSSPRRASKESSPLLLKRKNFQEPRESFITGQGVAHLGLGDHRLSMLRDKQDCCWGWGTMRTTGEGGDSTKLGQV